MGPTKERKRERDGRMLLLEVAHDICIELTFHPLSLSGTQDLNRAEDFSLSVAAVTGTIRLYPSSRYGRIAEYIYTINWARWRNESASPVRGVGGGKEEGMVCR